MEFLMAFVAAQLNVPEAIATTVVNVVLGAGTLVTVLGIIAAVSTGGATALLSMDWTAFKAEVARRAATLGKAAAIAW